MVKRLDQQLVAFLDNRAAKNNLRVLKPVRPEGSATVRRGTQALLNFASNDYLGLSQHPELKKRACEWTQAWGAGATASRLVCGTLDAHQAVEEKLAAMKGAEAALIFNSGYQANSAILSALLDKEILGVEPVIFTDRLIHASMHHGIKAAGLRQNRYNHNDLNHLEDLLKSNEGSRAPRFILTESVFSMDGDRADVDALADLAERYDAVVYLDEAHATGVLGPKGLGLSTSKIELVMGTFSKALGGFGAYLCCSKVMRDFLINRCAGFIYSTALPPAVLGAMDAALDLVPTMDEERSRLHANGDKIRQALQDVGLDTLQSDTQIIPAILGSEAAGLAAAQYLEDQGILAIAIRPPTVPMGSSRLRFAVSAAHTDAQVDRLITALPRIAEFKDA